MHRQTDARTNGWTTQKHNASTPPIGGGGIITKTILDDLNLQMLSHLDSVHKYDRQTDKHRDKHRQAEKYRDKHRKFDTANTTLCTLTCCKKAVIYYRPFHWRRRRVSASYQTSGRDLYRAASRGPTGPALCHHSDSRYNSQLLTVFQLKLYVQTVNENVLQITTEYHNSDHISCC